MEGEPQAQGADEAPEKATDIEMAMSLIKHIDNPCETEVMPGRIENIRGFYLAEAKRLLNTMSDPDARELLMEKVREYEPDFNQNR